MLKPLWRQKEYQYTGREIRALGPQKWRQATGRPVACSGGDIFTVSAVLRFSKISARASGLPVAYIHTHQGPIFCDFEYGADWELC